MITVALQHARRLLVKRRVAGRGRVTLRLGQRQNVRAWERIGWQSKPEWQKTRDLSRRSTAVPDAPDRGGREQTLWQSQEFPRPPDHPTRIEIEIRRILGK